MNQGPICAKVYPEGIQPIKGNNCGLIPYVFIKQYRKLSLNYLCYPFLSGALPMRGCVIYVFIKKISNLLISHYFPFLGYNNVTRRSAGDWSVCLGTTTNDTELTDQTKTGK